MTGKIVAERGSIMRFVPILGIALVAFWAAPAADKTKSKKDDKDTKKQTAPPITEVGGKKLDQWIAEFPSKDRSKSSAAIKTVLMFGPDQAVKAVPAILGELKKNKTTRID